MSNADKHYNSSYLNNTGKILSDLKQHSYRLFRQSTSGTIIDLGCGTGTDVIRMSQLIPGKINWVGIDHDEKMLEIARQNNTNEQIRFIQTESNAIPFENGSVHGLRAERLIQHLKNPLGTFNEAHRVLAPGHPFVVVETDWYSLTLYNEHTDIEKKIVDYLTYKKVNCGLAARFTPSFFSSTGFNNIHLDVFNFTLKTLKEANEYLWLEYIIDDCLKNNVLNGTETDTFKAALSKSDAEGYFNCSMNIIVASGIR